MKRKYKRKFKVPGRTIRTCRDFREKCSEIYGYDIGLGKLPCEVKVPTAVKTYTGRFYIWVSKESHCPFPINKPKDYIVSETVDGEWQCSCPVWKFKRRECHHIREAKRNPKKYEIPLEFTERRIETLSRILK